MNAVSLRWKLLLHAAIFLIAVVLLFIAASMKDQPDKAIWQTVLLSVSCSMIASTVISVFICFYTDASDKKLVVVNEWGIRNIDIRSCMNLLINASLDSSRDKMDIAALGMTNFWAAKGELLKSKIKQGMTVRILTLDPTSPQVAVRENAEDVIKDSIKKSIENSIQWCEDIDNSEDNKGRIEIRLYDSQVLQTYQNIDGEVFIGPHEQSKPSQQTITYHFSRGSKGAQYHEDVFERLWNNSGFCKPIVVKNKTQETLTERS